MQNMLRTIGLGMPLFVVFIAVLFLRFVVLDIPEGRYMASPGRIYSLLASSRALSGYIIQTILPIHLSVVHEIALGITNFGADPVMYKKLRVTDLPTVGALVSVIFVLLFASKYYKKYPLIVFGLLWFFVGFLPILNIFVLGTIYSERYVYSSLVGFVIMVCAVGSHVIKTTKKKNIVFGVVGMGICLSIAYGIRTYVRATEWANPISFWEKEVALLPYSSALRGFLGKEYSHAGDFDNALKAYTVAIELQPTKEENYFNRSIVFFKQNNFIDARKNVETALKFNPENEQYITHLQRVYEKIDEPDHEIQFYSSLINEGNAISEIYYLLGTEQVRSGSIASGAASLRRAIELKPELEQAYVNLGAALLLLNKPEEARDVFEQAIGKGSRSRALAFNLAKTYILLEDYSHAKELLDTLEKIKPGDPNVQELRKQLK